MSDPDPTVVIQRLETEVANLREEMHYHTPDEGHCKACGEYIPKTLAGDQSQHDCGRTPPLDHLPPTIYVCPVCGGHGRSRWGCWGTAAHPHDHIYMRPVHELVQELRNLTPATSEPVRDYPHRVPTIWIDTNLVEEHAHLKINTGFQYGQENMPTYERRHNHRNDAGEAGTLILRADQWLPFIQALAAGGYQTGLRVCWSEHTDDRRDLWNGSPDHPCVLGETTPVPWERSRP